MLSTIKSGLIQLKMASKESREQKDEQFKLSSFGYDRVESSSKQKGTEREIGAYRSCDTDIL